MSSSGNNDDMNTLVPSNNSLVSSFDNLSSSGRTFTIGSERTRNQDGTLIGIPSVGDNSMVSTSEMARLIDSDNSGDEDDSDQEETTEKSTEKDESSGEPTSKRKKLEYEETKIEITVAQLKEMELRGTILRPIYSEKLSELRRVKLETMFDLQKASRTTIIVSKTDTNMSQAIVLEGSHRLSTVQDLHCASTRYSNFRIPMNMFEVEDGIFSTAWSNCLSLNFSDSFKSHSSVSSRVDLNLIPSVILDIGMETHSNEQFRTIGKYSSNDSTSFIFKYLENTVNDTEIERLRNHPRARGEFWKKLVKRGLVLAAGPSKVSMVPFYILLMKLLSQMTSLKKLGAGKFPTANRIFINVMSASLKDDAATAELLSGYPSKVGVIKLQNELRKISSQDNAQLNEDDGKSDFIVHDDFADIEDSSHCFFYRRIPKDAIQMLLAKKLKIIVAEPNGECIHSASQWPAELIEMTTVSNVVYNGNGEVRSCLVMGQGLLDPELRYPPPSSSRKLSNLISKWFPGAKEATIHTVKGHFEIPQ